MTSVLCGQNPFDLVRAASPFAKLIAFGWEDGPTTGVVRCADCADAYHFDQLATDVDGIHDQAAWDRGEELRIFALAPLPEGAFDRFVTLLSSADSPKWPIWMPGVGRGTANLNRIIGTDVAPVIDSAGTPTLIIATAGLLDPIVAVRDYPNGADQAPVDWFALLGFAAGERLLAST